MPTGLERPFSKISDGSNNYSVKDSTARSDIATLNTRITNLEIDDLANINITSPTNGQALIYDATSEEWKNGAGGGGNVNEWVGTTSEFEEAIEQGEIADDTNILITNDYSGGSGGAQTLGELADTTISNPIDGQSLVYDGSSDMWVNERVSPGMLPKLYIHSEAGESQVKATSPSGTVIIATQVVGSTTLWECDAPEFGVYTIDAIKDGDDHQTTVTVDTVKVYHIDDYHYSYTLSVYAPFGSTVRVSATGETYTDTGEGDNPVVFGLHQPSTEYTVQVTVDGISESNTIESAAITGEDGDITFTFGTIVLTYADDFKGVNITCTKNETVITKKAPTSNNVMYFYPNGIGTWVISGEVQSGGVFSVTATVESLSTPVYVDLLTTPEGATVTPTDDIQTWLRCANLDKSYTTLAEVLADRETFETLIADSNACDYMARSTTWAGEPGLIPEMTGYNSPSGVVSSSGEYESSSPAWYAFDGWDKNSMTSWGANGLSNKWIQYKFDTAQIVKRAYIQTFDSGNGVRIKNFKILASNDNFSSDSNELYSGIFDQNTVEQFVTFENNTAYKYYRLFVIDAYPTSNAIINVIAFQLYQDFGGISDNENAMFLLGKYDYACNKLLRNSIWSVSLSNSRYFEYVLNDSVPKMTSATAPSGEVFSTATPWSNSSWFWLFNGDLTSGDNSGTGSPTTDSWVAYDFVEDVIINKVSFMNETQTPVYIGDFIIESSDDKVTWTEEASGTNIHKISGIWWHFTINPSGAHRYWRFHNLTNGGGQQNTGWSLQELQFYGRASSEVLVPLIPTMTSDTTPSGEVKSNAATYSGYPAYQAFDGNDNTAAYWTQTDNPYIEYDFASGHSYIVKRFLIYPAYASSVGLYAKDYKIEASNDGETWTTLYTGTFANSDVGKVYIDIENDTAYSRYRLYFTSETYANGKNWQIYALQFYAKTVQTNIIHSAPNDTIYTMENGSPVVLATTNSDGDGILDFSQFDEGTYTLYSSVAKDPTNLSNYYSKSFKITKSPYGGTTELYLMPDAVKTLYWWGYESSNLEDCTSANGWSRTQYTVRGMTHNTNDLLSYPQVGYYISAVGTKNAVTASKFHVVSKGIRMVGGEYGDVRTAITKAFDTPFARTSLASTNIAHFEETVGSSGYTCITSWSDAQIQVYAFWYE